MPDKIGIREIYSGIFCGSNIQKNPIAIIPPTLDPIKLKKYSLPIISGCFINTNPMDKAPKQKGIKKSKYVMSSLRNCM